MSYEAVLLHEFGHVGFAFGDYLPDRGVMASTIDPGPGYTRLHLHPVDMQTANERLGLSEPRRVSVARYDWNAIAWNSHTQPSAITTSVAPGLTGQRSLYGPRPLFEFASLSTWPPTPPPALPSLNEGDYAGVSFTYGPTAGPSGGRTALWPRMALSTYGEVMTTWLDCADTINPRACGCAWAYSDQPLSPATYLTGFVRTNTLTFPSLDADRVAYSPCAVAYDAVQDHFIVSYLGVTTGAPFVSHTSAYRPLFAPTLAASVADPTAWPPVRYLGDLAFVDAGVTSGILTVAGAPNDQRTLQVMRSSITWSGSQYIFSTPQNAAGSGTFSTVRHFGTSVFTHNQGHMIFWLDEGAIGALAAAWAPTFGGPATLEAASYSLPNGEAISSSVSAAFDFDSENDRFAVGFSTH